MNVVVISGCAVVDRHIVGRLQQRWPATAVVRPVDPPDPSTRDRLVRVARAPISGARRSWYRRQERHRERELKRLLPDVVSRRALPVATIDETQLNARPGVELVSRLRPDVLVLSGAPILRDDILAVPTIGTVNVHLGVAPAYRGEHTLFHALRQLDADGIGLTIHRVDRGIDTGPLLAHAFPAIEPGDDETTLMARCARLGAEVLVGCLEEVARTGRLHGLPQPDEGRLYRRRDRRVLRHDVAEWLGREVLGHGLAPRPERVLRHDLAPGHEELPA
ncbi:formyl transferase [Egicoccus sp. AB-alg2]|uniref:formyl transferase n=1 Tax=Egicoccus sp. AB-alg2 TaxID=3242693 RepID=UPI00359DF58A